jgi:hypothetical protein
MLVIACSTCMPHTPSGTVELKLDLWVYVQGKSTVSERSWSGEVDYLKQWTNTKLLSTMPWRHIHCLIKHHTMKTYWENGGIASHILDLGTRWRWVASFMPCLLYPCCKSPWYPLDRRLGGPQSQSGCSGKEKTPTLPLLGIEPQSRSL